MENLKTIIKRVPDGTCPWCGNQQFIISEIVKTEYLTNKYGEIIDSAESKYDCAGCCTTCGTVYPMKPTNNGFIPMTPLKIFIDNHISPTYKNDYKEEIKNPMLKE